MQYRTTDYEHDKRAKKRRGDMKEKFVCAINKGESPGRNSHVLRKDNIRIGWILINFLIK